MTGCITGCMRRLFTNPNRRASNRADRVAAIAPVISLMIDGLWLQKAAREAPGRDAAVALVLQSVTALLTEDERRVLTTAGVAKHQLQNASSSA